MYFSWTIIMISNTVDERKIVRLPRVYIVIC